MQPSAKGGVVGSSYVLHNHLRLYDIPASILILESVHYHCTENTYRKCQPLKKKIIIIQGFGLKVDTGAQGKYKN